MPTPAPTPALALKKLTASQRNEVSRWWKSLSPSDRKALKRGRRAPVGVVAAFVEPGVAEQNGFDESIDFYEYLVNHELSLDDGRRFHICSAHPTARAILARGHLPATFQCPRADATCPMRALLDCANGNDVTLSLTISESRIANSK